MYGDNLMHKVIRTIILVAADLPVTFDAHTCTHKQAQTYEFRRERKKKDIKER